MSFSLVLSSTLNGTIPFVFDVATSTYSFDVNLRDMIPPEKLNTKYKMRFSMISVSNPVISSGAVPHVNINLTNTVVRTQINRSLGNHFGMLFIEENNASVSRINTRPYDNPPVIIGSLTEVYAVKMQIFRSLAILATKLDFNAVLYFEPVDE